MINVDILLEIFVMHTGQRVAVGEQFLQIAKCPHGMQTTVAVSV